MEDRLMSNKLPRYILLNKVIKCACCIGWLMKKNVPEKDKQNRKFLHVFIERVIFVCFV